MHRRAIWFGLMVAALLAALLAPAASGQGPLDGVRVCIDPGHGSGDDPGAVHTFDDGSILRESDINLDVSNRLKTLLEAAGATVMLTRTDDSFMTNGDRYTAANAWGADILVSVHTNSTYDGTYDGAYALYFHSDDKALASAIQSAMLGMLDDALPEGATWIDLGVAKYASGVLLKSDMPAAMAEPLFMSNPWEAVQLRATIETGGTGCRRAQIADAIYQGILDYHGQPTEPTPEPTVPPSLVDPLHVGDLDGRAVVQGRYWAASVSVLVHDGRESAVPGATVTGVWSGAHVGEATCTTAADGRCTVFTDSLDKRSGGVALEITSVGLAGLTYDANTNHDPDGDSDGTTIAIVR